MKLDRKRIPSKLDPFEAELLTLDDQRKTLIEIKSWLAERGVNVSISCIGDFLTKARTQRAIKAQPRGYELPYFPKLKKFLDSWEKSRTKRRRDRRKSRGSR